MHKILTRRARQAASPKCMRRNKQMRSDNPCDCPYVPMSRIHPPLLWLPLIDFFFIMNAGVFEGFFSMTNDIIKTKVVPLHRFKNSSDLI